MIDIKGFTIINYRGSIKITVALLKMIEKMMGMTRVTIYDFE